MINQISLETHPYGVFAPPKIKYLLLGSFTVKPFPGYDWFYGSKRNQFWPILEKVYGRKLSDKKSKQALFTDLEMAITDIIYQCERQKGSNLDNNLINIVYNIRPIEGLLERNKIEKIFFSSRFVESKFRRIFKKLINNFPQMGLITLPSPSPRFAAMHLEEKIRRYQKLLPKLG